MNPPLLDRPLRVLRACLHLLVAGLLGLAAGAAVVQSAAHAGAIVASAAVLGAVYAAGAALPRVGPAPGATAVWLAALDATWLVLLALTPAGVYLAFPLFFLQLHLLPMRPGLLAVAATTLAAVAGFGWHQGSLTFAAVIGPALGAAVAVGTVLGYQALYRESQERARLIDELTATRGELAAAERTAGTLAERERLAREIHDTLAQGLTSIQLLLRAAERALPQRPDTAAEHVTLARTAAQDNLAEARRFVHALAPPDLDDRSPATALHRLCATTTAQSGLPVAFDRNGPPAELPAPVEIAILRIEQSALANAVQHARASRVEVTLSYMDDGVALDIVDDGIGFDPAALPAPGNAGGYGLAAMRARARALGATLSVESAPGEGTAVAVSFSEGAP